MQLACPTTHRRGTNLLLKFEIFCSGKYVFLNFSLYSNFIQTFFVCILSSYCDYYLSIFLIKVKRLVPEFFFQYIYIYIYILKNI